MATMKYFSGDQEVKWPFNLKNDRFARAFPGIKGVRYDSFSRWVAHPIDGPDAILPVTRIIEFKSNPSLHRCDGRCLHAKGRICECSCGGKNHGAGH